MNPQPESTRGPDQSWPIGDDDPFATPERLPGGVTADALSRFGDQQWYLSTLSQRNTEPSQMVNWDLFPEALRASFRRAGWALVNLPTPSELLERSATCRVEWPRPATMAAVFLNWRRFALWLCESGITALGEVSEKHLVDYALFVRSRACSHALRADALYAVSLLWGFAPHLVANDRIPRPAWEAEGMAHYMPANSDRNENATPAIHPAVMSPLLIWALRFVEDFADDIVAAWEEHQRLVGRIKGHPNPAATRPLRAFLERHLAENLALPGGIARGRPGIAARYLAGHFGTSERHVTYESNKYRTQIPVSSQTPLGTPIGGRLHGRPWKSHIDFHEAPILMTRLATACLIVILYLSGVRPGEALELEVGCCPEPTDDGTGALRYELHGLFFKGARDPQGNPAPAGTRRQTPWIVLPPVKDAVRVLECMVDGPLLFPTSSPWTTGAQGRRRRTGDALTCGGANQRIAAFIAWVNDYTADEANLTAEAIPDDPDGDVVVRRFRRTIAWHIARLPGGRIALAIQYGHLRASTTAEGYSGRARQGLRRVLDIETARAMADYLDVLADDLGHGEGVSGPAAGRMIQAARDARVRFGGKFLTPKQVDALFDEPEFNVYDNPAAFLTCNNDPAKALCHPERIRPRTEANRPPSIDRCNPACANIARTDTQIRQLRIEIAHLTEEATSALTPTPLRERLRQRITALQAIADRHEQTKIVQADPERPPPR